MAEIADDLSDADIHIRDKFQFELKFEYLPTHPHEDNTYTLEFYFFIPTALQITKETYSKQQFYADQTNFIRLKTPGLSLSKLSDNAAEQSPLNHIRKLYKRGSAIDEDQVVEDLKIYANIVRSAVRDRVRILLNDVHHAGNSQILEKCNQDILQFSEHIKAIRKIYLDWQDDLMGFWQQSRMKDYAQYVDEFVSNICERYTAGMLQEISCQKRPELTEAELALKKLIASEDAHRRKREERSPFAEDPERHLEYAVYRGGLLKKFVSEALFLSLTRKEPAKTFQQVTATVAAGIAMLFYLYFLSFHSVNPVLDSTAFVILSVVLYAMKDRLKEGIKELSSKLSVGWLPDYRTLIRTPGEHLTLGVLKEFFRFIPSPQIPGEVSEMRNTRFHVELEKAKRQETALYFRKTVILYPQHAEDKNATYELNDIFRFNISRFLLKASDPYKEHLVFDTSSQQVNVVKGPKVYHVNIIIKKTIPHKDRSEQIEYKRYRVVLDRDGIKRIEQVN